MFEKMDGVIVAYPAGDTNIVKVHVKKKGSVTKDMAIAALDKAPTMSLTSYTSKEVKRRKKKQTTKGE